MVVQVVVDVPIDGVFDYLCEEDVRVGQRVRVNFAGRRMNAIVVGVLDKSSVAKKSVQKVLDSPGVRWYGEADLEFLKESADIVWVGWGEMLNAALPDVLRAVSQLDFTVKEDIRPKLQDREEVSGRIENFYGDACRFHNFVLNKIDQMNARVYFWIVDSKARAYGLAEEMQNKIKLPIFVYHQGLKREKLKQIVEALNTGPCLIIGSRHLGFFPLINGEVIFLEDAWMDIYRQEVTPKYDLNYLLRKRVNFSGGILFTNVIKRPQGREVIMVQARDHKLLPIFVEEEFRRRVKEGSRCGIFMFGSGYARVLRCNACKSVQACSRCDRPYVLIRKNDRDFLYCPSCNGEFPWQGRCLKCGSISVRLSSMGAERWVKILRDRLANVPVFVEKWQIDKAGIYIYQHWQRLCVEFDLGLLLGLDRVLAIDKFYARKIALGFIASAAYKVRERLYVRTRFVELADEEKALEEELALRRQVGLPPYGELLVIGVRDKSLDKAKRVAELLVRRINKIIKGVSGCECLGPYTPVERKKRDSYYYNIDLILPLKLNRSMRLQIKELLLSLRKRSSVLVTVEGYCLDDS